MAPQAKASTKRTRSVPEEKIPKELIGMYAGEATSDDVSVDFDTSTPKPDLGPTEKLFSVNGTEYRIPVKFTPGLAVIYLDVVDQSRDVAIAGVLKHVIGKEGWAALMGVADRITEDQLKRILGTVNEKLFGAMEAAGEGNG